MKQTFLLLFTIFAGLLAGIAYRLYGQWTGEASVWGVIVPSMVAALSLAWLTRRWVGGRGCAALAVLCAVMAFSMFGHTVQMVHDWTFLSLKINLTYREWWLFVLNHAMMWFVPLAFTLVYIWRCNAIPRGRMTAFVGACVGLILARLMVGRMSTTLLIDICLVGLLLSAPAWLAAELRGKWTRGSAFVLAVVLLVGWYFTSRSAPQELLRDVNPFATIATRDLLYTGIGTEGVTLREGRLLRRVGFDTASSFASQLIPTLLKPQTNARIAVRLLAGGEALPTYDVNELKGQYDALYVELPPAWVTSERDYFGTAALDAALTHLFQDGVLVYAMDARCLDARMMMERVAILRQRFGNVQLWMTGRDQWQLVASRSPITTDFVAVSTLLDRPELAHALFAAEIDTAISLFSCFIAEASALDKALAEPISPEIRPRESTLARKLLFDGIGSQRLSKEFEPFRDYEMSWVKVPTESGEDLRAVLKVLQTARHLAIEGKLKEASEMNPCDPYLLGLADREISNARAWEKLAEHEKAIASYLSAFAIAKPSLIDVLAAASIVEETRTPERAELLYKLAHDLAPDNMAYLFQYMSFLKNRKQYVKAQQIADRVVCLAGSLDLATRAMLFSAQMVVQQGRVKEGLETARQLAEAAQTSVDKDYFILAYAQLLIDTGSPVLGINVKRHYAAYHELLPQKEERK
ncbi:MAG: hypothetical protein RR982_01725 [Kiritimatiellia bacterium]